MQFILGLVKKYRAFLLYVAVGGGATVVEWVFFYLFDGCLHWNYIVATGAAFLLSTFANWALGRILLFQKTNKPLWREITDVYLTSIGGFLLNLGIMYLLVDLADLPHMAAKIIATAIVFFYNYFVRKFFIYKGKFKS